MPRDARADQGGHEESWPNMPLQPTVTRLLTGAFGAAGARQRLNAGR